LQSASIGRRDSGASVGQCRNLFTGNDDSTSAEARKYLPSAMAVAALRCLD